MRLSHRRQRIVSGTGIAIGTVLFGWVVLSGLAQPAPVDASPYPEANAVVMLDALETVPVADEGSEKPAPKFLPGPKEKPGPKGKPGAEKPKPKKTLVEVSDVPDAALKAIRRHSGTQTLDRIERESKDEQDLFIARWKADDQDSEVRVSAEGKVLELKESMSSEKVPAPVRAAATKECPADDNLEFKRNTVFGEGKSETVFEVRSKSRKGPPLKFAPNGEPIVKGKPKEKP